LNNAVNVQYDDYTNKLEVKIVFTSFEFIDQC